MSNTCRRIMLTGIAGGFIGGAVKMGMGSTCSAKNT